MATIAEMLRRFQAIDLTAEAAEIITDNPDELLNLERKQLFEMGEDSKGQKLKPYRNPKYARAKNELNPLPGLGTPDYYVTGDFQRSLTLAVQGQSVIFDATNYKLEFLLDRSPELLGVTDDSISAYRGVLLPAIVRRIMIKTGTR